MWSPFGQEYISGSLLEDPFDLQTSSERIVDIQICLNLEGLEVYIARIGNHSIQQLNITGTYNRVFFPELEGGGGRKIGGWLVKKPATPPPPAPIIKKGKYPIFTILIHVRDCRLLQWNSCLEYQYSTKVGLHVYIYPRKCV